MGGFCQNDGLPPERVFYTVIWEVEQEEKGFSDEYAQEERDMSGPRYSIIPGAIVDDERLKQVHLRVITYLGRMTDQDGWCWAKQKVIAEKYGFSAEAVCRAIKDLCDWGHLDKNYLVQNGKKIFFYRVKMDRECTEETLKKVAQRAQDQLDHTIKSGGPTCSQDQVPLDRTIKSYNKDKRPPFNDPHTESESEESPDVRVCEEKSLEKDYSLIDQLKERDPPQHVVEHFIVNLFSVLLIRSQHTVDFMETMANDLKNYSIPVLQDAAKTLRSSRSVFPTIAMCLEACEEAQRNHMFTVYRDKDPEAWKAWRSYYKAQKAHFRVGQMDTGEIIQIQVPTQYPPVEKGEKT